MSIFSKSFQYPSLATYACAPIPDNQALRQTYLAYRYPRTGGVTPAIDAMRLARKWLGAGKSPRFAPRFSLGFSANAVSESGTLWIENLDSANLRVTDETDSAYYMDDFYDEICKAVVVRLPARKGVSVYLAGTLDPYNEGAARLDVVTLWRGDLHGAANHADYMARDYAEDSRAHNEAFRAGQEYATLREEITMGREEISGILKELRAFDCAASPSIGALLAATLRGIRADMRAARVKAKALNDEWLTAWRGDSIICTYNEGKAG